MLLVVTDHKMPDREFHFLSKLLSVGALLREDNITVDLDSAWEQLQNHDLHTLDQVQQKIEIYDDLDVRNADFDISPYRAVITIGSNPLSMLGLGGKVSIQDVYPLHTTAKIKGVELPLFPMWGMKELAGKYKSAKESNSNTLLAEVNQARLVVRHALDASEGHVPVYHETEVVNIYNVQQLEENLNYCKVTKDMFLDIETTPKKEGLTKKDDIKEHSVDFNKSKVTTFAFSFQTGVSAVLPFYHYQSWFNVGRATTVDFITPAKAFEKGIIQDDFYRHEKAWKLCIKDGKVARSYNGTIAAFTEEMQLAFLENINYCMDRGIDDLLTEIVFPLIDVYTSNRSIRKAGWNVKFDLKALMALGITFEGIVDDSMMKVHTLNELWFYSSIGKKYKSQKAILPIFFRNYYKYGQQIDFANEPFETLGYYNGQDTDGGHRTDLVLDALLMAQPLLYRVYRSLERPKIKYLAEMEFRGTRIDTERINNAIKEGERLLAEITQEIYDLPKVRDYINFKMQEAREKVKTELWAKVENWYKQNYDKDIVKLEAKEAESLAKIEKYQAKVDAEKAKETATLFGDAGTPKKKTKNEQYLSKSKAALLSVQAQIQALNDANIYVPEFPNHYVRNWGKQLLDIDLGKFDFTDSFTLKLNSTPQLGEILYLWKGGYRYDLPVINYEETDKLTKKKLRKTGPKASAKKEVLNDLLQDEKQCHKDDGFIPALLQWRVVDKVLGTFLYGIRDKLGPDYTIHTNFSTVRTQRLGSYDINLQNIITRTNQKRIVDFVKVIKRLFIPWDDTQVFGNVDYKQQEIRVTAENSLDRNLIEAYKLKLDIHMLTAARSGWQLLLAHSQANGLGYTRNDIFTMPATELIPLLLDESQADIVAAAAEKWEEGDKVITYDYLKSLSLGKQLSFIKDVPRWAKRRQQAKAENFSIIYKTSPSGLQAFAKVAYGVIMTLEEAAEAIERWLNAYPEVAKYQESAIAYAKKHGFTRTWFGSKRHTPYINETKSNGYPTGRAAKDMRIAVNSRTQGTGTQMLLLGCLAFDERSCILGLDGNIQLPVHDSVGFTVGRQENNIYRFIDLLTESLEEPPLMEYFGFEFENVAMETDMEIGVNWKDLIEFHKDEKETFERKFKKEFEQDLKIAA